MLVFEQGKLSRKNLPHLKIDRVNGKLLLLINCYIVISYDCITITVFTWQNILFAKFTTDNLQFARVNGLSNIPWQSFPLPRPTYFLTTTSCIMVSFRTRKQLLRCAFGTLLLLQGIKKRQKRKWWVKPWSSKSGRHLHGFRANLVAELRQTDSSSFGNFFSVRGISKL